MSLTIDLAFSRVIVDKATLAKPSHNNQNLSSISNIHALWRFSISLNASRSNSATTEASRSVHATRAEDTGR
ncbi:hypothetical protein HBI49_177660 [Parastagonospora nodorum]|nr:hypothetical protein HBH93_091060 [Parastagonospora nodorum]KAH4444999.1 hypothetical protein HBH91_148720 [Parastagonospora nodorum]KAH4492922.1 hypothetical protein HBH89_166840 [Parastagonospora nodorum]KAH4846187.1 hypothetical protein HBH75_174260 [Parastagonospora nodorum]KAH4914456.1 hypothetical protein HBH74_151360 [Parastagonospora nodorum]